MPYRMKDVFITSYSTGGSEDGTRVDDAFDFVSFDDTPSADEEEATIIAIEQDAQKGDTVPTETLTLNYEEIKWTYDENHKEWIDILSF